MSLASNTSNLIQQIVMIVFYLLVLGLQVDTEDEVDLILKHIKEKFPAICIESSHLVWEGRHLDGKNSLKAQGFTGGVLQLVE